MLPMPEFFCCILSSSLFENALAALMAASWAVEESFERSTLNWRVTPEVTHFIVSDDIFSVLVVNSEVASTRIFTAVTAFSTPIASGLSIEILLLVGISIYLRENGEDGEGAKMAGGSKHSLLDLSVPIGSIKRVQI